MSGGSEKLKAASDWCYDTTDQVVTPAAIIGAGIGALGGVAAAFAASDYRVIGKLLLVPFMSGLGAFAFYVVAGIGLAMFGFVLGLAARLTRAWN
jgi:hypothetical protein